MRISGVFEGGDRYSLPRLIDQDAHLIEVPVDADLDFEMSGRVARVVFERGRRAAAARLELVLAASELSVA